MNLEKLFVDELEKHFTVIPEDVYAANPEKCDSEIVAILPWFAKPVVTEEMVKRMPKLVIVASISAGYNHLSKYLSKYRRTPTIMNYVMVNHDAFFIT